MAEIITIRNSAGEMTLLNVTRSVGDKGVNSPDDVYLVQALLRELTTGRRGGNNNGIIYPFPTGRWDRDTRFCLQLYQQKNQQTCTSHRDRIATDCLINHAVGERSPRKNKPWTILQMNYDVIEGYMLQGFSGTHIEVLMEKYPQLSLMFLA